MVRKYHWQWLNQRWTSWTLKFWAHFQTKCLWHQASSCIRTSTTISSYFITKFLSCEGQEIPLSQSCSWRTRPPTALAWPTALNGCQCAKAKFENCRGARNSSFLSQAGLASHQFLSKKLPETCRPDTVEALETFRDIRDYILEHIRDTYIDVYSRDYLWLS